MPIKINSYSSLTGTADITPPKFDNKTHKPSEEPKIKQLPKNQAEDEQVGILGEDVQSIIELGNSIFSQKNSSIVKPFSPPFARLQIDPSETTSFGLINKKDMIKSTEIDLAKTCKIEKRG